MAAASGSAARGPPGGAPCSLARPAGACTEARPAPVRGGEPGRGLVDAGQQQSPQLGAALAAAAGGDATSPGAAVSAGRGDALTAQIYEALQRGAPGSAECLFGQLDRELLGQDSALQRQKDFAEEAAAVRALPDDADGADSSDADEP